MSDKGCDEFVNNTQMKIQIKYMVMVFEISGYSSKKWMGKSATMIRWPSTWEFKNTILTDLGFFESICD